MSGFISGLTSAFTTVTQCFQTKTDKTTAAATTAAAAAAATSTTPTTASNSSIPDAKITFESVDSIKIGTTDFQFVLRKRVNGKWQNININDDQKVEIENHVNKLLIDQANVKDFNTYSEALKEIIIDYKLDDKGSVDFNKKVRLSTTSTDPEGKPEEVYIFDPNNEDFKEEAMLTAVKSNYQIISDIFKNSVSQTTKQTAQAVEDLKSVKGSSPASHITSSTSETKESNLCWSHALLTGFHSINKNIDPKDSQLAANLRKFTKLKISRQHCVGDALEKLNGNTEDSAKTFTLTDGDSRPKNCFPMIYAQLNPNKTRSFDEALAETGVTVIPEYLIVPINRVIFNSNGSHVKTKGIIKIKDPDKIIIIANKFMQALPTNVDINDYEEENRTYEIASFIVHEGSSANSGHYVTYIKNPDGTWNKHSYGVFTQKISKKEGDKLMEEEASMYFLKNKKYKNQDINLGSLNTIIEANPAPVAPAATDLPDTSDTESTTTSQSYKTAPDTHHTTDTINDGSETTV